MIFTAPLVPVLVVMLVSCDKFSKSCSRSSRRSLALPPPDSAEEICWFNVAISESRLFAELTSLVSDEFSAVRSVPNWLLMLLKVVARVCAAPIAACRVASETGEDASALKAEKKLFNCADKPDPDALDAPVLVVAPVPLRNSPSAFWALCSADLLCIPVSARAALRLNLAVEQVADDLLDAGRLRAGAFRPDAGHAHPALAEICTRCRE